MVYVPWISLPRADLLSRKSALLRLLRPRSDPLDTSEAHKLDGHDSVLMRPFDGHFLCAGATRMLRATAHKKFPAGQLTIFLLVYATCVTGRQRSHFDAVRS